jgi:hypothetical protein
MSQHDLFAGLAAGTGVLKEVRSPWKWVSSTEAARGVRLPTLRWEIAMNKTGFRR